MLGPSRLVRRKGLSRTDEDDSWILISSGIRLVAGRPEDPTENFFGTRIAQPTHFEGPYPFPVHTSISGSTPHGPCLGHWFWRVLYFQATTSTLVGTDSPHRHRNRNRNLSTFVCLLQKKTSTEYCCKETDF